MKHPFFLSAALACAALTACGGGGSSTPDTKPDTSASTNTAVTAATSAVNSAAGATALSTDPSKLAYDVVADMGDTWRITLDTSAKTFALKVINTAYSLADTTGTITAGTVDGTRTPYTLKNQQGTEIGTLLIDSSTRSASGNITLGGKSATVTGSADKATALSKLAGTYNFIRFSRDVGTSQSGGSPDAGAGQALVSADGSTMTLCLDSTVGSDGTCTAVDTSVTPEKVTLNLSLDANGHLVMKLNGANFGLATLLPSNLGKALQMDMLRTNEQNVRRTGAFYFAEAKALSTTAMDGQWACAGLGADANTVSISGTGGTAKNLSTGTSTTAVFKYNQVGVSTGWKAVNGFVAGGASTDSSGDYDKLLPLSSSLVIDQLPPTDKRIRVCRKTGS